MVILEDHALMREAIAARVVSHLGDARMVYEGASVFAAQAAIEDSGADCIVLDLDLDDGRDPHANIAMMVKTGVPVLIVSAMGTQSTIRWALEAGVFGYISKSGDPDHLTEAIDSALDGRLFTSPEAMVAIMANNSPAAAKLSDQERRAMMLYASGMKMRVVASTMGISEGSAREYIKRVRAKYAKAGTPLPTKTEMYRKAVADGIIDA